MVCFSNPSVLITQHPLLNVLSTIYFEILRSISLYLTDIFLLALQLMSMFYLSNAKRFVNFLVSCTYLLHAPSMLLWLFLTTLLNNQLLSVCFEKRNYHLSIVKAHFLIAVCDLYYSSYSS